MEESMKANDSANEKMKNSSSKKLFWTILIIIFLLLLVALATFFYARKIKSIPSTPETPTGTEIAFEKLYDTSFGFIERKKTFIVDNKEEFEKLWPTIIPMGGNNPLPEVDFSREIVAVVALGEFSNCNFLDINKVFQKEDKTIVRYTVTGFEEDCPCTLKRDLLVEVIKFKKTSPVEFEEKHATKACKSK